MHHKFKVRNNKRLGRRLKMKQARNALKGVNLKQLSSSVLMKNGYGSGVHKGTFGKDED